MNIKDIVPGRKYRFHSSAIVIAEYVKIHLHPEESVVSVRGGGSLAWCVKAEDLSEYDEVEEKARELYEVAMNRDAGTPDWPVMCGSRWADQWRRVARHVLGVK